MRFIDNGPNIPDELLFAQDEGQVVFFCGAGVSMAHAKLPSFAGLAEKVMNDLGATEDSKAKRLFSAFLELNENAHTHGLVSADHIFSSLRLSFVPNDINRYVAKNLLPQKNPNLSAHKTILKLARLRGGQTRLITTNFDLLFETCNRKLKSVTRSNLPRIVYSDNDWGVVHLHGKVKSDYSGPDHDGFVLSSSEFGDAYLAQGWARNFVKDVLGKYIAVFIGYSADDPPVKYLLEGLQQGNGFNHKIYAFQSGQNDDAAAQWDEKGVEAIAYDLDEAQSHNPLWNTLEAWGVRSKDPVSWKKGVFSKGRKGPAKLRPHERGMVAHLMKSRSGAKAFEQTDPPMPSEWLCVFDPSIRLRQSERESYPYSDGELINPYQLYALDDDPPPPGRNDKYKQPPSEAWDAFTLNPEDYETLEDHHLPSIRGHRASNASILPTRLDYIARWIGKVSHQRIAAWWAGQQLCLHPQILRDVKQKIIPNKEKPTHDAVTEAWNTIFELSYFYDRDEYEEYGLKNHIESSGWSNSIVREYTRISAPFLKRGTLYTHSIPRDNRKKISVHALVKAEVDYPKGVYDIEIPDEYLAPTLSSLRINVEKAVDMEQGVSGWLDLCAIEPDENPEEQEFTRSYALSGYVLHFARLFQRLVEINKEKAKSEYIQWRNTDPIFIRLRIWASGLKGVTTETEFTNEIISLEKADFWPFKGERDLLLSLKNRWNELSPQNRTLIEKKILKGPSKAKTILKAEHKTRSAYLQLSRFHWLKGQGCKLGIDLEKLTEKLLKIAPDWKPEYAENAADSHDGGGGWVRTDTDWSSLKSLPLSEILDHAEKHKGRDYSQLTEYAPFAGLCDDAPLKALGALSLQLKKGGFSSDYWESYLSRDQRKKDTFRLKVLAGGRITQIPNENFKNILLTASRWFKDVGPELREKNIKMFEAVWNKFIDTITLHENSSGSALVRQEEKEVDWTGEAINSPSGNLAELHMTDPVKENLKAGKGYPEAWLAKVDQLLHLPNDAHRYAMVIFAFNLSWFHFIDPEWTELRLLKIIEDEVSDKNDSDAIWSGFMWGAKTPNAKLYIKLKPHFLMMANEKTSERRRHVEILSGILLSGWGSKNSKKQRFVTDDELRNVLLNAGDDFRSHVLWHLERWCKNDKSDWDKELLGFLQKVWPKHKKVRTSKTSARLCDIALAQTNQFPAISNQVSQLVSKIGNEHVRIPRMRITKEDITSKYPEDFLNLLYAILPDQPERWPYGASEALKNTEKAEPKLLNDPRLIELKSRLYDL